MILGSFSVDTTYTHQEKILHSVHCAKGLPQALFPQPCCARLRKKHHPIMEEPMKRILKFVAILVALTFTLAACSNSSSDDGGGSTSGTGSDSGTSAAGFDYSGSYTVAGKHFSLISLDGTGGTYTMTGSGGSDSGTFAARSAKATVSDGSYTLTSKTLNGTFILTVSGNGAKITLENGGSLGASGNGGNLYVASNLALPAPVGTNEFAGLKFAVEKTDSHKGVKKIVYEFTSAQKLITTTYENNVLSNKCTSSYSYNSTKKLLYLSAQESITLGDQPHSSGRDDPYYEAGFKAGDTITAEEFRKKVLIPWAEAGASPEWISCACMMLWGDANSYAEYSYDLPADKKSVTLTAVFPECGKITGMEAVGMDRVNGKFRDSSLILDRGRSLRDASNTNEFMRLLSDDGSNLEFVDIDFYGDGSISGYASASYTVTDKGTSSASCTLTITSASAGIGKLSAADLVKAYTLAYEAEPTTLTAAE